LVIITLNTVTEMLPQNLILVVYTLWAFTLASMTF
jgi:hypothetical protein